MKIWEDEERRGPFPQDPLCPECPPLYPTLKSDGGNDAAAAAVVAVMPPSFFLFTCRFPGRVVVVLGEPRRIDGEAQLCIACVVKTIWESTTQTRKCVSLVAASFNQCGPHLGQSRPNSCLKSRAD